MLLIRLSGGLGNQLFQIFTVISYSIDNNDSYRIFKDKGDIVSPCDNKSSRHTYWDSIFKNISSNTIKHIKGKVNAIYEKGFEYNELPVINNKELTSNFYMLCGYFQSYKYFYHNLEAIENILNLYQLKETLRLKLKDNYEFINTCSLHFRLGDLKVGEQKCHGPILSIEYYINAIERLIKDTNKNDWNILYFYEKVDEEYIKSNILLLREKFQNIKFLSINHDLTDWEQILTMSLCKNNIIANSTFSLWGAYLNKNENNVYYPNTWFSKHLQHQRTDDLFLQNNKWVNISNT